MKYLEEKIKWGIIGCGDVCEIKSGPAFNKVADSELVAVMRRNETKAADFAKRHCVPKYYTNAEHLINDPEINAIYIATPPASHEEYSIMSIKAGKPVYIEKPLSVTYESTARIDQFVKKHQVRATGAYYRRRLPLFEKLKQFIHQKAIGEIMHVSVRLSFPPADGAVAQTEYNWRLDPKISGGGLFHDLAPHMLDILYWIFGKPIHFSGNSVCQDPDNLVADHVYLYAEFPSKIPFNGVWDFDNSKSGREDQCKITGSKGEIIFSFFDPNPLIISSQSLNQSLQFDNPENVQLPMIADTVKYFRGEGPNPCSISDTMVSMEMINAVTGSIPPVL